jgi:hypothetical protein
MYHIPEYNTGKAIHNKCVCDIVHPQTGDVQLRPSPLPHLSAPSPLLLPPSCGGTTDCIALCAIRADRL